MQNPIRLPRFVVARACGLLGAAVLFVHSSLFLPAQTGKALDLGLDPKPIDRVTAPTPTSFAPMLREARKPVVAVYTAEVVRIVRSAGSPEEELLRRFFGIPTPRGIPEKNEIEEQRVPQGVGSGVIVSEDGYILTNSHVVSDQRGGEADEVLVRLNDQRELPATIVGRDPKTDIAVLKVEAAGLPAAKLADSDLIEVGDVVFAIGNPMGVGLTVTQGIVSATGRAIGIYGEEGYEDFIQTDASINPGNSGGALVDTDGRLIGINSAILSRSGGNVGIGFAIPTHLAANVTRQLTEFGEVRRGFLGVQISPLTPDMAEAFGLENVQGVVIDEVMEGLAAKKAGLKRGDVIVKVGGRPIRTPNDLRTRVAQQAPGTKLAASLLRDGKPLEIELEVGDQSTSVAGAGGDFLDGITVQSLNEGLREQLRLQPHVDGLVVTAADPRSPYARYLPEGTVILEINDLPVNSLAVARKALRPGVNKLYVYRGGRTGYLALRID